MAKKKKNTFDSSGSPVVVGSSPQKTTTSKFGTFTPYSPPPLPSGSYDPAIDAQLGAAQRGLGDLVGDYNVNQSRAGVDYGLQQSQLVQQRDRGYQDIASSYNRGLQDYRTSLSRGNEDNQRTYDYGTADYNTQLSRGGEDYNRSVGLLQRSYQQLQNRQAQSISAAGLRGGASLQAAAKRAANEAIDRQPLDTGWQRQQQDIGTGKSRLLDAYNTNWSRMQQDYSTGTGRLGEDFNTNNLRLSQDSDYQIGSLGLQYQRSTDDAATQLLRAQREAGQFGVDTEAEKAFAAGLSGYVAPGRGDKGGIPQNEHVDANGNHYQTFDQGGVRYYVRPDGSVIKTKKL